MTWIPQECHCCSCWGAPPNPPCLQTARNYWLLLIIIDYYWLCRLLSSSSKSSLLPDCSKLLIINYYCSQTARSEFINKSPIMWNLLSPHHQMLINSCLGDVAIDGLPLWNDIWNILWIFFEIFFEMIFEIFLPGWCRHRWLASLKAPSASPRPLLTSHHWKVKFGFVLSSQCPGNPWIILSERSKFWAPNTEW